MKIFAIRMLPRIIPRVIWRYLRSPPAAKMKPGTAMNVSALVFDDMSDAATAHQGMLRPPRKKPSRRDVSPRLLAPTRVVPSRKAISTAQLMTPKETSGDCGGIGRICYEADGLAMVVSRQSCTGQLAIP